MTIRVAIVEDHDDFREGLAYLIDNTEGFKCVGKYSGIEEALRRLPLADFFLMDIGLPGKSGIEGVRVVKERLPAVKVIMLTVFEDSKHIFEAILAGADGYILKKTPPGRILQAVEEASTGGMPMTPVVARQVIDMFKHRVPAKSADLYLTDREKEILTCLVDGLNYAMTAEKLFISLDTVRNHIRHIYEKLHVHSKSQAVAKAIRQSLI